MPDQRKPHVVITPGSYPGRPAPREFVTRVKGAGTLTVTPGPDADWGDVLRVLAMCAPPGSARRWHLARTLYDGAKLVRGVGDYRDGATLGWAS